MNGKSLVASPRWRIAGRYTVDTALHVGSGDTCEHRLLKERQQQDESDGQAGAAAVVRDQDNRLYLPGSSVRGAVRAALLRHFAGKPEMTRRVFGLLGFGPENTEHAKKAGVTVPEADTADAKALDLKDGLGGKVSFADAFAAPDPETDAAVRQTLERSVCAGSSDAPACEKFKNDVVAEKTLVEVSVKIAPETRTVDLRHLANREMVPAGAAFDVVVTGSRLDEDEVALLMLGLELAGEDGLGGGRKTGAGRLSWTLRQAGALGPDALAAWIAEAARPGGRSLNRKLRAEDDPALRERLLGLCRRLRDETAAGGAWKTAEIALAFDGPFLVRDPDRSGMQKEGEKAAMPRLGPDGAPILPGRSIKGALRARANRIERTLCERDDPKETYRPVLTEWLFGTAAAGAVVEFDDFRADPPAVEKRQHFVAIDRFTGGQAPRRLYQFAPVWSPTLRGRIRLDSRRIENSGDRPDDAVGEAALWLLLLTLRDLEEGEIQFGLGAAKGYGGCTARVTPGLEEFLATIGPGLDLAGAFLEHVNVRNGGNWPQGPKLLPLPTGVAAAPSPAPSAGRPPAVPVSQTEFINPYNFVPVIKTENKERWFPNTDQKSGFQHIDRKDLGRLRHDRWLKEEGGEPLRSGRILCRLTTENPTFIGADRDTEEPGKATRVKPFEIVPGVPAIPASSLRGLFSSIAEAASQSSLRVLTDRMLSYRMAADPKTLPRLVGRIESPTTTIPGCRLLIQPLLQLVAQKGPRGRYEQEPISIEQEQSLPIPDWVTERCNALIGEQAKADTSGEAGRYYVNKLNKNIGKYNVHGEYRPEPGKNEKIFPELIAGDIVFYDIAKGPDGGTLVSHVAPSQIWRGRVERDGDRGTRAASTVFDFFKELDNELLPFDVAKRRHISPAELLFGFVSETAGKNPTGDASGARPAYAGRVRFSFGRLEGADTTGLYGPTRVLKILSSPKPPSPPFYFKRGEGHYGKAEYIPKQKLHIGDHIPNGRKFYHDHGKMNDKSGPRRVGETWHPAEHPDQKISIAPIKADKSFLFHVDFDNLNEWELGLLCFALRPEPEYRHRIGMGKSLGLGRVRIEPLALFEIDRFGRYLGSDAPERPRYAPDRTRAFLEPASIGKLPVRYQAEDAALNAKPDPPAAFEDLAAPFTGDTTVDKPTLDSIKLFGKNPPKKNGYVIPVRQPQLAGYEEDDEETETFQWYAQNDRDHRYRRSLPSVVDESGSVRQLQDIKLRRYLKF